MRGPPTQGACCWRSTGYRYDDAGRFTRVDLVGDGRTDSTSYGYTSAGELCWSAPGAATGGCDAPQAGATAYGYDAAGRPNLHTDPLGHRWRAQYDAGGRLQSRTDPNGVVATHGYDAYGRAKAIAYSDGRTPTVSYGYDNADRRTSLADGTGTTTSGYDPADNLTLVTPPAGGSVQYGYDNAKRLARVVHRDGKVFNVSYGTVC